MTATDNLLASRNHYADQCSALRQENQRLRAEQLSQFDLLVIEEALRLLAEVQKDRREVIKEILEKLP